MASSNIERFDQLVGEVFASLYDSFPVSKKLHAADFARAIEGSSDTDDEMRDRVLEIDDFFEASISWLRQSGYIYFDGQESCPTAFYGCVLTAKTLAVLKKEPSSLAAGTSLGSALKKATRDGVSATIKTLTSEALERGARLAYASVVSWAGP